MAEGRMSGATTIASTRAKGAVYRVQVLGHSDQLGPVVRVEAIVDATSFPPRVTGRRDLSELGPGYDLQTLLGRANISSSVAGAR